MFFRQYSSDLSIHAPFSAFVDVSPEETVQKSSFEDYKESVPTDPPNNYSQSSEQVSWTLTVTLSGLVICYDVITFWSIESFEHLPTGFSKWHGFKPRNRGIRGSLY